jgi:hypothetical protein
MILLLVQVIITAQEFGAEFNSQNTGIGPVLVRRSLRALPVLHLYAVLATRSTVQY